eukprot:90983-Pyramimonas_sp.AAC.1
MHQNTYAVDTSSHPVMLSSRQRTRHNTFSPQYLAGKAFRIKGSPVSPLELSAGYRERYAQRAYVRISIRLLPDTLQVLLRSTFSQGMQSFTAGSPVIFSWRFPIFDRYNWIITLKETSRAVAILDTCDLDFGSSLGGSWNRADNGLPVLGSWSRVVASSATGGSSATGVTGVLSLSDSMSRPSFHLSAVTVVSFAYQ